MKILITLISLVLISSVSPAPHILPRGSTNVGGWRHPHRLRPRQAHLWRSGAIHRHAGRFYDLTSPESPVEDVLATEVALAPPPEFTDKLQAQAADGGTSDSTLTPGEPMEASPTVLPEAPPQEVDVAESVQDLLPTESLESVTSLANPAYIDASAYAASSLPTPNGALPNTSSSGFQDSLEAHVQENRRKLTLIKTLGGAFAILSILAVLVFFALHPRGASRCRRSRIESSGTRPISSWFPFPVAPTNTSTYHRKPVKYEHRTLDSVDTTDLNLTPLTRLPHSKFSVTSSDYSHRSTSSAASSADTILAENTQANVSIPPVRPPRTPTMDGHEIFFDDMTYFADEQDGYLHSDALTDTSFSTAVTASDSPLLPPDLFFTMDHIVEPSVLHSHRAFGRNLDAGEGFRLAEYRHSRAYSAPMFAEPRCANRMRAVDPIARKVLLHRRSRSTSGWAYPRKRLYSESKGHKGGEGHQGNVWEAM